MILLAIRLYILSIRQLYTFTITKSLINKFLTSHIFCSLNSLTLYFYKSLFSLFIYFLVMREFTKYKLNTFRIKINNFAIVFLFKPNY